MFPIFAGGLGSELMTLHTEAAGFKSAAYATSTKKTYSSMQLAYLRFCAYFGLRSVPAAPTTVVLYVTFLVRTLKPSSLSGYLNIIRLMHAEVGLPNPLVNWELDMVRRGILRCLGQPPKQKLAITLKILQDMHSHLDMSASAMRAFWAACLVAFYAFLRKSSLLPKDTKRDGHYLCLGDVAFSEEA